MNPLRPTPPGKRRPCNSCPACLAPPCNECCNCRNTKSHKKCKQRICPNLSLPSPSPSPLSASGRSAANSGSGELAGTSRSTPLVSSSPSLAGPSSGSSSLPPTASTALLSVFPWSSVGILDTPTTSADEHSEAGPADKRSSASLQNDEETGGRKRQRLQEEHLQVEAVTKNFVLAKQNPSGAAGFVYQCLKCNIELPTKIMCTRHALNCGKAFTGKRRGKNARKITCNICPYKATTEGELAKHRRQAHKELCGQRVRCLTCNDTFATVKILKKHILAVHKNSANEECEYCDKKFANKANLKRHMVTHLKSQAEKEAERTNFRMVDLTQWDESLGVGTTSRVAPGDLTEEVSHDVSNGAGSDLDEDSDLESDEEAEGFSINQLKDAFIERCRQMGDSGEVLNQRRQALERRLIKVSPATPSSPALNQPSTPQVDL